MIEKPFPLAPHHVVREDGAVRRVGGKWLRPCTLKRGGYLGVSLWTKNRGKTWPVHIIVAITFHGPRPSPKHDAAHVDSNKLNCHFENICWKTRDKNEADKVEAGTSNRGSRNGMATLSNDSVRRIRIDPRSNAEIGAEYGVTAGCVAGIKARRRWKHL